MDVMNVVLYTILALGCFGGILHLLDLVLSTISAAVQSREWKDMQKIVNLMRESSEYGHVGFRAGDIALAAEFTLQQTLSLLSKARDEDRVHSEYIGDTEIWRYGKHPRDTALDNFA